MERILYQYDLNLTTWVYLSSLLTMAIFIKFGRIWSMRNLDLALLIALAPGLLMIDHSGDIKYWGYVWLLALSGLLLIRLLFDSRMVRRPLLEPNLSPGGLTFLAFWLLVFLMVNVVTKQPTAGDLEGPRKLDDLLARAEAKAEDKSLVRHGPGYPWFFLLPSITTKAVSPKDPAVSEEQGHYMVHAATARTLAILSHLAVVIGMIMIGVWHFDNIRTGVAAATLYLMLPYTAQMTGRIDHVLPAALMVWAVAAYRRPVVSGMLLGLATGAIYYPIFLLPLWLGFYWQRGLLRFSTAFVTVLALMVVPLIFTSANFAQFVAQLKMMFGWPNFTTPITEGFWSFHKSANPYRIPVLAAFLAMCGGFAIWPAQKNLGTLLSCSAAVMVGTQFWIAGAGGIYLAWYLPLLLLTVFRPNLEDRVALATLGESWFARRRGPYGQRAA
ncbi:MAG TPA: glycosyltransferase family 87 protein [Pirellulales bacterium]|jgi:hypothetical protein|nr:glycosyltransferase family 87 protein [Pirellulales bacterium]